MASARDETLALNDEHRHTEYGPRPSWGLLRRVVELARDLGDERGGGFGTTRPASEDDQHEGPRGEDDGCIVPYAGDLARLVCHPHAGRQAGRDAVIHGL